jgi:hypothetical protein
LYRTRPGTIPSPITFLPVVGRLFGRTERPERNNAPVTPNSQSIPGFRRTINNPHCRQSDKKTKSKILDEFVRQTGCNRKYALHLLTHWGKETFLMVEGKPVKLKAGTAKRRKGGGRTNKGA